MTHHTRSTCPYCGVGCGVIIEAEGNAITGVRGDPDHPANFGKLCSKGANLHLTAQAHVARQTRLLQPLRRFERNGPAVAQTWNDALDHCADQFARIITQHGPDAVGFYVSGQLLTEDYYVFNKLAKGLVGTNNIDTNSRLCMSSAVAGYKQTLGADAPPCAYEDLDHASAIFMVGSNTAWAHPVLYRRIEAAKARNPSVKWVVIDPRRTDTATDADLFLQLQPGTDVMLFHGMLHTMLWEGWVNQAYIDQHTQGFADLKALVRDATPERVAQVCGLQRADLWEAAKVFATSSATLSLYCQGLNQSSSGTAKNAALINLHLATGHIGKPGAGPFSLTGQPNAMGGREVGGLANLLSAHRDLANPAHRAEIAALWGVPDVPAKPGKTAVELFEAAADGEVKALWIACTNPAQSMPDQATVRRALERLELVVLQEAFVGTATAAFADVLLPATTWGEKEGTVTNSERRISRVRAAVAPPSRNDQTPRHDWAIAADFGQRLAQRLGRGSGLLHYGSPEAVWQEHQASTRGRDLDITGMSYALLEARALQWPMPSGHAVGAVRLYENGVFPTPSGKAQFAVNAYRPVAETRDARHPFSLNTGRLRDQWHGMNRTGLAPRSFGHAPEPELQMHPQDMARKNLADGDLVHVSSRRGALVLPARACASLGLNQCFVAMHWGEEYLSGQSASGERLAGINALTTAAYCPTSKQPELKHSAVKVLKAELPWQLTAMAWLPQDSAWHSLARLRALMRHTAYCSLSPFADATDSASGQQGVLFRAAGLHAPSDQWLDDLEGVLGLCGPVLRYVDQKRDQRRVLNVLDERLVAMLLAGDVSAQGWLGSLLRSQQSASPYQRQLLNPSAQAPTAIGTTHQAVVCSCFNINAQAISETAKTCSGTPTERLQQLQAQLKCGTSCGSCLPQLKEMLKVSGAEKR